MAAIKAPLILCAPFHFEREPQRDVSLSKPSELSPDGMSLNLLHYHAVNSGQPLWRSYLNFLSRGVERKLGGDSVRNQTSK